MGKQATAKAGEKKKVKVNFIPVDGDVIEAIARAVEPNVSSVLNKHGASLKIDLIDILRNHARV